MKNIFRSYVFTWWQMAIFKVALIAVGIVIGAAIAEFVLGSLWWWIGLWVIPAIYLLWLSLRPGSPTRIDRK